VLTSDDFFPPMACMLAPEPAVFIPGKYDDNGKWMDGWESRRKRVTGHDFCIVKLGVAGELMGVNIDTSHFTGNFPPAASIDACRSDDDIPHSNAQWIAQSMYELGKLLQEVNIDSLWRIGQYLAPPIGDAQVCALGQFHQVGLA
jgi:allantoicase